MANMVEYKWSVLERLFQSQQQRAAIYKTVNIEIQDSNPGSRGLAGPKTGPLAGRTSAGTGGPLSQSQATRPTVRISPNYVVKTLGRRRAWAMSLGLAGADGVPTADGDRLLQTLAATGFAGPSCMTM